MTVGRGVFLLILLGMNFAPKKLCFGWLNFGKSVDFCEISCYTVAKGFITVE